MLSSRKMASIKVACVCYCLLPLLSQGATGIPTCSAHSMHTFWQLLSCSGIPHSHRRHLAAGMALANDLYSTTCHFNLACCDLVWVFHSSGIGKRPALAKLESAIMQPAISYDAASTANYSGWGFSHPSACNRQRASQLLHSTLHMLLGRIMQDIWSMPITVLTPARTRIVQPSFKGSSKLVLLVCGGPVSHVLTID